MVRKFAAALVALVLAVGAVFADEVKAVFVKFADGKLTVKVDDKEKEYKVPADTKIKRKNKQGEEEEVLLKDSFGRRKEGDKLILTVEGDTLKDQKRDRSK